MHVSEITKKDVWESFLDVYAPHALFQRWDWGLVQKETGGDIFRFGYYTGDTLSGIAQALVIRAKRGNFLHVRHGPVLMDWNDETAFDFCVEHLKNTARKTRSVCVRMNPLIVGTEEQKKRFVTHGGIPAAIHAMDAEHCLVLDLAPTEDELLSGMRKTTRYEIRHAEKMGVEIVKTTKEKDIEGFLSLYDETAKRHGFVEHHGIKEEYRMFTKQHQAILINGFFEKKLMASALILFSGNEGIYHHGASVTSRIPVSSLIQWEAIREAKQRGMKEYNFWGIAPTEDSFHPWHGLSEFKKGFGGYTRDTIHAYDFPVSVRYRAFRAVEAIRKRLKGY